ncbi:hypothetical protein CE195_00475 [Sodalis-like symbiont of Philaenus spumarius]|nr:hypothetical protein CE195_00475 [Sodalis-like symbiont of Philaenus spumarius]
MKDPTVILNGVNVRVDSEERYNLNDLHKSAVLGGNATESQRTGEFLERAQVKYFVQELAIATIIAPVRTINGGKNPGSWGLELIAIRYAAWIEPKFEIQFYNDFV